MTYKFYSDLKNMADDLIKKFGQKVTVTRGTTNIGSGYGVFTEINTTLDSAPEYQIAVAKRAVTLNALKVAPEVGDILVVGTSKYSISAVKEVRPTDLTIVYQLEAEPCQG